MPPAPAIPHVETQALAGMIAPSRCALLVIDVQVDFVSPDGAMARFGADLSNVPAVLDRIETLIAAARRAGAPVAFARVMTRADSDSAALKLLHARKGAGPEAAAICREGEAGSDYYRITTQPGDIEVAKRLYNAFHGTTLEEDLRARGVDTLVVVGLATHCCVDATSRDAFHRDFNVFVVSDATDAYGAAVHQSALHALSETCALITDTQSVLAAWT